MGFFRGGCKNLQGVGVGRVVTEAGLQDRFQPTGLMQGQGWWGCRRTAGAWVTGEAACWGLQIDVCLRVVAPFQLVIERDLLPIHSTSWWTDGQTESVNASHVHPFTPLITLLLVTVPLIPFAFSPPVANGHVKRWTRG